jgi:hypothetical protein
VHEIILASIFKLDEKLALRVPAMRLSVYMLQKTMACIYGCSPRQTHLGTATHRKAGNTRNLTKLKKKICEPVSLTHLK